MDSSVLEIIKLRDVLRVAGVDYVPGLSPPTVQLKGADFSSVDVVVISGVEVTDFVVVDQHTIYAAVPPNIASVTGISVLSNNLTRTAEATEIRFKVGTRPKSVKGVFKLVQHFLMWLMKDPSSDIFSKNEGGGLLSIVGSMVSSNGVSPLQSNIVRAVNTTASQIARAQSAVRGLPADERLLSATVVGIGQLGADDVRVKIKLVPFAGPDAIAAFRI